MTTNEAHDNYEAPEASAMNIRWPDCGATKQLVLKYSHVTMKPCNHVVCVIFVACRNVDAAMPMSPCSMVAC